MYQSKFVPVTEVRVITEFYIRSLIGWDSHRIRWWYILMERHSSIDDLLKITVAWELLTRLHLEFIDNKLLSWNMKYHNQSFIWTTVNLSKSVTVIFETRLSPSQAEFFNHKSITVRTTEVVSASLWTWTIIDHEDAFLFHYNS